MTRLDFASHQGIAASCWKSLVVVLSCVAGCSQSPTSRAEVVALPLGREFATFAAPAHAPASPPSPGLQPHTDAPVEGVLALRDVLARALLGNPELATFSWALRASEARTLQARLLPNPEFEAEVEDFGGSGEFSDFDAAESTLAISQLVELGGKRAKRVRLAELGRTLAAWDYEAARLDVLTATAEAFVDVLAGQQRAELRAGSLALARTALRTVSERVEAGKSSPLEQTRAELIASQAEISLERALRTLTAARTRLAAMWGQRQPTFESVSGAFDETPEPPNVVTLEAWVNETPDIARWAVEVAERKGRVKLASANGVTDVTVRAGARLLEGSDETAFVIGLSVPLPLFDRNQGERREAEFSLAKAREESRAAEVRVRTALSEAYQSLLSTFREVATLRDVVVPAARSSLEGISESYRQGKLTQLDVLDAQRTLFAVREQYTEALSSFHHARVRVEGLVGRPIIQPDGEEKP